MTMIVHFSNNYMPKRKKSILTEMVSHLTVPVNGMKQYEKKNVLL